VSDLVAPIAAARANGFGLGVHRAAEISGETGWQPAEVASPVLHPALADELPSPAVAATWQVEGHAWFVAAASLAGVLVHGRVPPLDRALLRYGSEGRPEAIALPADGWRPAGGADVAAAIAEHLEPLVDALSAHRRARPLWRSAGDRLGQAARWCADAFGENDRAIAIATAALEAPTALRAEPGFSIEDGQPYRRRTGCCLAYRLPDTPRCVDCANPDRLGAVAHARTMS
jgi:hypothetical protein